MNLCRVVLRSGNEIIVMEGTSHGLFPCDLHVSKGTLFSCLSSHGNAADIQSPYHDLKPESIGIVR